MTLTINHTTGEIEMQHPERLLIAGSMEDTSFRYTYGWREWYLFFCAAIVGLCIADILVRGVVAFSEYMHK